MNKIEKIVETVSSRDVERIFIQIPEGLKTEVQKLQGGLEKKDIKSVASLDPCYGACDLKDVEARRLGCDLILHLGHNRFCGDGEIETLYFPWYYDLDPVPILREEMDKLDGFQKVGLLTSINFHPALEKAKKFLEGENKQVFTETGEKTTEEGQILGCDVSAGLKIKGDIDCFLHIGSGKFHPLGIALESEKPLFILDFEREEIWRPDFDKFERQRLAAIDKARDSRRFGIIVSTKKGQSNIQLAEELKRKIKDSDRKAWIFSMDEVTREKLMGMKIDCLVNTACPRIAIEHRTDFKQPILNPKDLEKLLQNL